MSKIFRNVCPRDCYSNCKMVTEVENGRIISLVGEEGNPDTGGALCAKGYAYLQRQYAPERLLNPLKKKVSKDSERWEVITWDQALTEIAQKLIKIKTEERTLLSVCLDKFSGNTGLLNRVIEGFFNSIGYITVMAGSPCEVAGIDAQKLSYGACKKPHPSDMVNAKVIILWGANPAWTAPHQMQHVFKARLSGTKIVVIDPYLTATAARADLYIQIKPGMDGFLALGMARVLLEENLHDDEFLREFTYGWEKFRAYLQEINLQDIAQCTGIPEQEIRELARLYGKNKPSTIWLGVGAQHNPNGGQNFRSIDALIAMTGNVGVPGGNVHFIGADIGRQPDVSSNILPPEDVTELSPKELTNHRKISTGRFAELGQASPPIRMLWVAGRNPVAQDPDSLAIIEVLKSIETVVVVDTTLTATAHYADYVLPITTFFEQEDIVISKWNYSIGLNEQAVQPPGECKSDLRIMSELADILNKLAPGFSTFPSEWDASKWLDQAMKEEYYSRLGIGHYYELLGKNLYLDIPHVPWQDRIFYTPSGKYEFEVQEITACEVPALPVPGIVPQQPPAYPLQMLSVRSYANLNSQFSDLLSLLDPGKNCLMINNATGKVYKINEGEEVCVYNWLGEIRLPALFTPSVPPDLAVVHMTSNTGTENELNRLIALQDADLGKFSTDSQGLTFKQCFVNLCKVDTT